MKRKIIIFIGILVVLLFILKVMPDYNKNIVSNDEKISSASKINKKYVVKAMKKIETIKVSKLGGVPFDSNKQDLCSPYSWASNYGKTPEIISYSNGENIDIAWKDQSSNNVYIIHVVTNFSKYSAVSSIKVPILGIFMGFAKDNEGNYYVASGRKEEPSNFPDPVVHRKNIVRISKIDKNGKKISDFDVDYGRGLLSQKSECILKPTVASSSRLLYGKGMLSLVHGINTPTGHQKSITTHVDAKTGKVITNSTIWVSHSFDQRLIWDEDSFIEMHLGDAYPRAIVISKNFGKKYKIKDHNLFYPKGNTGDNKTFTNLGGIVKTEDKNYGYLAVFSTERQNSSSNKDLSLVRIKNNFESISNRGNDFIDKSMSKQVVNSAEKSVTNYMKWLTNNTNANADRSRIAYLRKDKYIILWEQWKGAPGGSQKYLGTYAMLINSNGDILKESKKVSNNHISRGDDIIVLKNKAVYITGNRSERNLILNSIDENLKYNAIIIQ